MTQRTDHTAAGTVPHATTGLRRLATRLPRPASIRRPVPDPRVADELAVIAEHRVAVPPPPGSVRPVVRPYAPEDRPAVEAMVDRCSTATLQGRFHAPPAGGDRPAVAGLLLRGPAEHLVAEADGAVVGLASLHPTRDGDAELAVLVEDAWQHTGLGHRLTGHVMRLAATRGVRDVVADVMREPRYLVEHLARAVEGTTVTHDGPVATVRIPVAGAAPGGRPAVAGRA